MKLHLDSKDFEINTLILLLNKTKKSFTWTSLLVTKRMWVKKDYKAKISFWKDYHFAEKTIKIKFKKRIKGEMNQTSKVKSISLFQFLDF